MCAGKQERAEGIQNPSWLEIVSQEHKQVSLSYQGQSAHQPLELRSLGGKQEGQKSCRQMSSDKMSKLYSENLFVGERSIMGRFFRVEQSEEPIYQVQTGIDP